MTSSAPRLAEFACTLRLADIPQEASEAAARSLLDIVGVAIRGRRHEVAKRGLAGARALSFGTQGSAGGGAGTMSDASQDARTGSNALGGSPARGAVVWGTNERLDLGAAMLANGIAAHVDDFDDTHSDGIVHGSAVIAPVVVALAAARARSGAELLAAFIAGWEVAARVGLASRGTFHERGFHTTSIAGVFGATAAAARLMGLDVSQATHALGLAGSQASGINEYLSNGSSSKTLHCGWAANAALVAASMAQAGMTGPASVFEGRHGLLKAYGHPERCDPEALDRGLGTQWEVTRVSIKPYPCCHFAHAFVDCAAQLRAKGVSPADIESIECLVDDLQVPMICEPAADKLAPATPYVAKFSLPYLVAAGLIDGGVNHASFEPAQLQRAPLRELAARVRYRVAAKGETRFPETFPGRLTATLRDGRTVEERLDVNLGHPDNPLSFGRVVAKFKDNATLALGEAGVARVVGLVQRLPSIAGADFAESLSSERIR